MPIHLPCVLLLESRSGAVARARGRTVADGRRRAAGPPDRQTGPAIGPSSVTRWTTLVLFKPPAGGAGGITVLALCLRAQAWRVALMRVYLKKS